MITKEQLIELGLKEVKNDYASDKIISFDTGDKVDLIYNSEYNLCALFTGKFDGNGNEILFKGRIENINELLFVLNSVKAYANDYKYLTNFKIEQHIA